jgi:hypothetical protein
MLGSVRLAGPPRDSIFAGPWRIMFRFSCIFPVPAFWQDEGASIPRNLAVDPRRRGAVVIADAGESLFCIYY